MESSSGLNSRQEILATFASRVTEEELGSLSSRFDIPSSYSLVGPSRSDAVFKHGGHQNPLYIKHLEFGLRLPLHPFVDEVCTVLGISPAQLKPNAIAMLMAFIVICHWVGLEPSLAVLSHLIGVRVYRKEPHYHFHNMTSFKLVEGLPDSIKDWKENFVWVEGEGLGLACSNWPEIIKDGLKARALSPAEAEALERVKKFTGSRRLKDLFDNSVLRVAGISPVKPSAKDLRRATRLILGNDATVVEHGAPSSGDQEGPSARPVKRFRGDASRVSSPKGSDTSPLPTMVARQPSHPSTGAERGESAQVRSRDPKKAVEGEKSKVAAGSGSSKGGLVIAASAQATSLSVTEGSSMERTRRQGKEPRSEGESAGDLPGWPHPYRLEDVDETNWGKLKRSLMGTPTSMPQFDRNPRPEDRYTPTNFLDQRASVLESRRAQMTAVEQFWLPRDREMLSGIHDVGLHQILRSYLIRGALVEEEVFRRLSVVKENYEKLRGAAVSSAGVEKGSALEKALLDISAQEEKLATMKDELEMKERMVGDLKASNAEMKAELDGLRKSAGAVARVSPSGIQINDALLEKDRALVQVEVERQATQSAKRQLEDERLAHEKTRMEKVDLEKTLEEALARVAQLESPAWRKEVVDEYRLGLIGRAEVTIACKAGYDYLLAQLPADLKQDSSRFHYPPRIAGCLEVLEDIERQGGTLNLDEEDEEAAPVVGESRQGEASDPASHPAISELPLTPGADMDL